MTTGGALSVQSMQVEWKIENFCHLPKRLDYELQSPRFTFCDCFWNLQFYPNGEVDSSDWISLYLVRDCPKIIPLRKKGSPLELDEPSSPLNVSYTFGIQKPDGSVLKSYKATSSFGKWNQGWGTSQLILKSEFFRVRDVVDQDGILRIYCVVSMDGCEPVQETSSIKISSLLDRHKFETEKLKKELSTAVKHSKDVSGFYKHQDLTLSENFKELFKTRYKGDTAVQVGDQEFIVHKLVLAARSSVFRVMFETDMAEKKDGVITIEDCEPDHFKDFLLFLYSGRFDIVRPSNALQLCLIADKYNVVQLKKKCFEIMSEELSPESVCDAVYLATLYEEKKLLNTATKYFIENASKIVCTPKWLSFLSEHTVMANELFVKMTKSTKQ